MHGGTWHAGTRHAGTWHTGSGPPWRKLPAQGGPGHPSAFWAQNQHPGSKPSSRQSVDVHRKQFALKTSERRQNLPRENSPSPGSPAPAPRGLLLTGDGASWLPAAAAAAPAPALLQLCQGLEFWVPPAPSEPCGCPSSAPPQEFWVKNPRNGVPPAPTCWLQHCSPRCRPPRVVPRKLTASSGVRFKNSLELLIIFRLNRKHPWEGGKAKERGSVPSPLPVQPQRGGFPLGLIHPPRESTLRPAACPGTALRARRGRS